MLFRSPAYPGLRLQSVAREYAGSIELIAEDRDDLLYIRIQNRDNNGVFFWHGSMPSGVNGDGPILPDDPGDWTAGELSDAVTLMQNFAERIAPGEIWEPSCAHTGKVYALGQGGTPNRSQIVVGFQADQEQGVGGHKERGT